MNSETLIVAFPLIPLFALGAAVTVHLLLRRDISRHAVVASHALQLAAGIMLLIAFRDAQGTVRIPLAKFAYSIAFAFDRHRLYFLAAYLTPLIFSVFRLRQLDSFLLRVIFLFYLGGCSGLIVAGDVFNFFVFYELMIMAAYVLIAIRRDYFASVKYMLFGAVSSAFFLAGIITLYASGEYLGFDFVEGARTWPAGNFIWLMVFFSTAFFIKGAFFPVSAWVSTCHSATISLVSAFLGSFTVFSGIFGLLYLVVKPAAALDFQAVFVLVRGISLLTILLPGLFAFFEPDLKRIVAGSTVYTMGFIGLMLSYQLYDAALAYMVVHAAYKSLMFYLLDDVRLEGAALTGRTSTFIAGAVCVLFTTGFFPSLVHFVKAPLLAEQMIYRMTAMTGMFLLAAGFLKYRRIVSDEPAEPRVIALAGTGLLLHYFLFSSWTRPTIGGLLVEAGLLAAAFFGAPRVFEKLSRFSSLDRRWVFAGLNAELFWTLLLFAFALITLMSDAG